MYSRFLGVHTSGSGDFAYSYRYTQDGGDRNGKVGSYIVQYKR
jgi:hypothetical protein